MFETWLLEEKIAKLITSLEDRLNKIEAILAALPQASKSESKEVAPEDR